MAPFFHSGLRIKKRAKNPKGVKHQSPGLRVSKVARHLWRKTRLCYVHAEYHFNTEKIYETSVTRA